ncbi:MAG TPA: hypothetical protein VKA49_20720 [Flavitalea sp.]|nr:hypothetical protein [Flavitalea sp.]
MYKDESTNPPVLVCTIGKTALRYHLRAFRIYTPYKKNTATGLNGEVPMSKNVHRTEQWKPGADCGKTRLVPFEEGVA